MVAEELRRAIKAAPRVNLDAVARLLWAACAEGRVSEAETTELAALIEECRHPPVAKPPRTGSRARTPEGLLRRRRVATCGRLPPSLACQFTQGEVAVLAIIALDAMTEGTCSACIASIGARAGVGRTTVKNTLRRAKRLELITVEERRLTRWRNLTNIVTLVSPEWNAWNRLAPRTRPTKTRPANTKPAKTKPATTRSAGPGSTGPRGSGAPGGGVKSVTGSNTLYKEHPESGSKTPSKHHRSGSGPPERGGPDPDPGATRAA